MVLRQSAFQNSCLHGLHSVSWALIFPCYWFLERFLSSFMETSLEKKQRQTQCCSLHPLQAFLCSAAFLLLLILSMPIALLGFLMWVPLQAIRRPFTYQQNQTQGIPKEWSSQEKGKPFIFVSANLCLLPDGLARFSNLCHTQRRSAAIGKNIVQGVTREKAQPNAESLKKGILNHERPHAALYGTLNQSYSDSTLRIPDADVHSRGNDESAKDQFFMGSEGVTQTVDPLVITIDVADEGDSSAGKATQDINQLEENIGASRIAPGSPSGLGTHLSARPAIPTENRAMVDAWSTGNAGADRGIRCEISSLIPEGADFICLQEVFDKRAARRLCTLLSPVFEHVLYDVGVYGPLGCCSDFKFFNSGLFLASRYPILAVKYRYFPNGSGEDALAAKGLLCVQVLVGVICGKRIVGYMNCTHLHAPEADGHIRCAQLSTLMTWISEFQEKNTASSDLVAFDVLCGDFNFDNCSPDDHLEQKHEIFSSYEDPCRVGPKKDKEWAIGTLLQPQMLYDDAVNSAQSLQRTLEKEEGRRKCIAPPIYPDGTSDESDTGAPWTGRRIDYILHRGGQRSSLKSEVEEFTFITHLAGLTDHVAVGLRLFVSCPPEGV
ncbi:sphingomyelin phosphodiesterase 5-like [Ambystoma mexicanum]|uniref:sphingomyelin phosphodiesterase 5-like n=1 Tax=Ambystoma mexicanum TaxID=8296 RepID=UPI0037E75EB1